MFPQHSRESVRGPADWATAVANGGIHAHLLLPPFAGGPPKRPGMDLL
jgi:hypothetical protein